MTASKKTLEDLHNKIAETLLEALGDKDPDPRVLAVAIKFLKDNGITAIPTGDSPLGKLVEKLPFLEPDEAQMN